MTGTPSPPAPSRDWDSAFPGEPRAENTTVAELLDSLNLPRQRVAVEVNLRLVPRELHAEHLLREGDQLEVVTLVGGG